MSGPCTSMRSCWAIISSSSKLGVSSNSPLNRASGSTCFVKSFSTSVSRLRNTPVRRPRDPLDSSPDAIRHKLPTGETFIIRPPPTAPTPYNLGPSQTTVAYPSTSLTLPPALKPTLRKKKGPNKILTPDKIAMIQFLRKEDPIQNTISRLAKVYECSPTIVKIAAPLSAAVRRFKETEVKIRRANWGANKTLQRELRKERKALW